MATSNGTRTTIARSALGALAGGMAVGAARSLRQQNNHRRPGIHIPRDVKLDPRDIDIRRLIKQIGDAAEQIELRSEDVRQLSAQAKRLSRRLT